MRTGVMHVKMQGMDFAAHTARGILVRGKAHAKRAVKKVVHQLGKLGYLVLDADVADAMTCIQEDRTDEFGYIMTSWLIQLRHLKIEELMCRLDLASMEAEQRFKIPAKLTADIELCYRTRPSVLGLINVDTYIRARNNAIHTLKELEKHGIRIKSEEVNARYFAEIQDIHE